MLIGVNVHIEKEEKFLEVAVPSTMEDFIASTRYTITKELKIEYEFDDFLLKGKIDEVAIDSKNVYIIDDKPNARPYKGPLRQLWSYCMLFKNNYPNLNKNVFAVLRDRDTDIQVWHKPFENEDNIDVMKSLYRIKGLFEGITTAIPNTQPQKCRVCVLHKLKRCKYSVG